MENIFASAAIDNASYEAGRVFGMIFALSLYSIGALKCYQISKRETTNTKCAYSLMIFLIALFVSSIGAVFNLWLEVRAITVVCTLFAILLLVGSGILALIGLIEISQARGKYKQGKWQALATLGLCGGLFLLAGIFAVTDAIKRRHDARVEEESEFPTDTPAEAEHKDPSLNYKFTNLKRPWVKAANPQKLNPYAKIVYQRKKPEMMCFVIAERTEQEETILTEQIVEAARLNIQAVSKSAKMTDAEPMNVNGLEGKRFFSDVSSGSGRYTYAHWCLASRGFAYQVIFAAPPENRDVLQREFEGLASNFDLIDHNASVLSLSEPLPAFKSPHYGYTVRLKANGWRASPKIKDDVAESEFTAARGAEQAMLVIPVWLGGQDVAPEILASGLLSCMGIDFQKVSSLKKLEGDGRAGYTFSVARTINTHPYDYRFKVEKKNGFGYLAGAWVRKGSPLTQATFDELQNVEFDPANDLLDQKKLNEHERAALALTMNQIACKLDARRQYEAAFQMFKIGSELKEKDEIIFGNAVSTLSRMKRTKEAVEMLEAGLPRFENSRKLRAEQAELHALLGNNDAAIAAYVKLFEGEYENAQQFKAYIDLLETCEKWDEALAALDNYEKHTKSLDLALRRAYILRDQGKTAEELALLDEWTAKTAFDGSLQYECAEAYLAADKVDEAEKAIKRLLDEKFDTCYCWQLKGRVELKRKAYREAKASFEKAMEKDPNNRYTPGWLKRASSLLGQGENSEVKTPIEPVAIPAALKEPAPAEEPGETSRPHAHYLTKVWAVSYLRDKELKSTNYYQVKVFDKSGVDAFTTIEVHYDPLSERVYVNTLKVRDSAGALVSSGNVDDYYVLDDARDEAATARRTLYIPVSGLKPGCTIELMTTRADRGKPEAMRWLESAFVQRYPASKSSVFLCGDVAEVKHSESAGLKAEKIENGLCWHVGKQKAYRWEPLQQSVLDFAAYVQFGDAKAAWEKEAGQYLASLGTLLKTEPEAAALAARLTEGAVAQKEKIGALLRHLQSDYTYKAIEFGKRSRIPQKAAQTIANKYGDCKDHSLLLAQMLNSLKIPAHLTLVCSGGNLNADVPSLDQFDHMIVCAQCEGKELFFDCTHKDADLGSGVPPSFYDERVLVLDPAKPRLARTGSADPRTTSVSIRREIKLSDALGLSVREELVFRDLFAAGMRRYLKSIENDRRKETLQSYMNDLRSGIELDKVEVEGLERVEQPVKLSLEYRLKNVFTEVDGVLLGKLPAVWEQDYLKPRQVQKRETPFKILEPMNVESEARLALPADRVLAQLPKSEKFTGKFHTGEAAYALRDGALEMKFSARLPAGKHPAAEYANYCNSGEAVVGSVEAPVALKKKEIARP